MAAADQVGAFFRRIHLLGIDPDVGGIHARNREGDVGPPIIFELREEPVDAWGFGGPATLCIQSLPAPLEGVSEAEIDREIGIDFGWIQLGCEF